MQWPGTQLAILEITGDALMPNHCEIPSQGEKANTLIFYFEYSIDSLVDYFELYPVDPYKYLKHNINVSVE